MLMGADEELNVQGDEVYVEAVFRVESQQELQELLHAQGEQRMIKGANASVLELSKGVAVAEGMIAQ